MYLKHAPTIISILRESLSQLAFIRAEQREITIKQQNLIYSPIQILQQMNQLEAQKKKKEEVYVVGGSQSSSTKTEEVNTMAEDESSEEKE